MTGVDRDPELGGSRPPASAIDPLIEVAQRHLPDIVVSAGLFKPNAPGRSEFTSWSGFQQRAQLKSRSAYLAERLLVAVTPIELAAFTVRFGGFIGTSRRWGTDDLIVAVTPGRSREPDPPPAFLLASRSRPWTRLEIQPISDNDVTPHLAELDRRRRLRIR